MTETGRRCHKALAYRFCKTAMHRCCNADTTATSEFFNETLHSRHRVGDSLEKLNLV